MKTLRRVYYTLLVLQFIALIFVAGFITSNQPERAALSGCIWLALFIVTREKPGL